MLKKSDEYASPRASDKLACADATLHVQFYDPVPGQPNAVKGIAEDNKGNLFKLTL